MLSLKKLAFMNQRTRVVKIAQGLYINEFIIIKNFGRIEFKSLAFIKILKNPKKHSNTIIMSIFDSLVKKKNSLSFETDYVN
jgi:hypothetical protein